MSKIIRGQADEAVLEIQQALDAYEAKHPGCETSLYRHNPASIRLRVIDRRFAGQPRSRRHEDVWGFLTSRLSEDRLSEISQLLAVTPDELKKSFANFEYEQPLASH